jgi:hypothetical protein
MWLRPLALLSNGCLTTQQHRGVNVAVQQVKKQHEISAERR